jgi:hypothetical protein
LATVSPRKQRTLTCKGIDPTKPAHLVIHDRFFGLSNFCRLTGYPHGTVHRWMRKGFIPPLWQRQSVHPHILAVAAKAEIELSPADFVERQVPANDTDSSAGLPPRLAGDSAAVPAPLGAAAHPGLGDG